MIVSKMPLIGNTQAYIAQAYIAENRDYYRRKNYNDYKTSSLLLDLPIKSDDVSRCVINIF